MKRQSWLVGALIAAVAAGAVVSLRRCGATEGVEDAGAPPVVGPPPRLLAELTLATPNATWGRVQRGVGGAIGFLPPTLPGVLVAALDLDPRLAGELDGGSPMHVVVAGEPADPGVLVAVHLADPRKARTVLGVDGGAVGGTAVLPARPGAPVTVAIADAGFLYVARHPSDLALGPFATRPRPAGGKEAIVGDVTREALGALVPRLGDAWKGARQYLLAEDARMRKERGRAPDFGDPVAIVGLLDGWVQRKTALLGDFAGAHVAVDAADDALSAAVTLAPAATDGPARAWLAPMQVGDAAPLLALPASSLVAVVTRDAEAARQEQAAALGDGVATALGPRLPSRAAVDALLADVTKARGDVAALALDEGGVFLRTTVRDPAAAERAVRGGLELLGASPFKDALRVQRIALEDHGAKVVRAPAPGKDAGAPADTHLRWTVDAALTLLAGDRPPGGPTLGEDPLVARFAGALGGDASSLVVVQPGRLLGARPGSAPATLALGKRDGAAVVRLDVADALVREVVRSQIGL